LKATHKQPKRFFPFFEAFSFLLNNGKWLRGSQKTMKPSNPAQQRVKSMDKDNATTQKLHQELVSFEKTMEELRLLKSIAADLKNYRRMIRLKRYD
jgi:hypothetical protein